MAIVGIGTDIAEIARFAPDRISERFLRSVFTDAERAYCQSRANPAQHYAGRFAAKEAAAKALNSLVPFVSVCQIEVIREGQAPCLRLIPGRHGEPIPTIPENCSLHVSISHSGNYAVATAIVSSQ